MMCEKPFMKCGVPNGKPRTWEERLAATPLPCGQCFPCRINRARTWTFRLLLEQTQHEQSCFTTLSYNNDFLPKGDIENGERVSHCSLDKKELQNYLKRLRKLLFPVRFRYFAVGEYGLGGYRPHYHILFFGLGIEDKHIIKKAWSCRGISMGRVFTGFTNRKSIRYVCNYVMKNLNNTNSPWVKENYPMLVGREPEFITTSRRPTGLGADAIKKFCKDWAENPFTEKKVLRQLSYIGRSWPVGRYLIGKICLHLNIDESDLETELWDYQQEIFDRHLGKGVYYDNIVNEHENDRLVQKKRHEFFTKKRSI